MSTNHLCKIAPANISVGNGSDELIRSLIATCLGRSLANPTFSCTKSGSGVGNSSGGGRAKWWILWNWRVHPVAIEQTQNPPIPFSSFIPTLPPKCPNLWIGMATHSARANFSITWICQTTVRRIVTPTELGSAGTFSKSFRLQPIELDMLWQFPKPLLPRKIAPGQPPTFSVAALVALQQRQLLLASIPSC